MRSVKLKFTIPRDGEANSVGKLFKVFFECMKPGDNFVINDGVLNMLYSFEETPVKIIEAISELPFQNIITLVIEEVKSADESSSEEANQSQNEEGSRQEAGYPKQVTIDEYLMEQEAKEKTAEDLSKTASDAPKEPGKTREKKAHFKRSEEIDEVGTKVFEDEIKRSKSFEEFVENIGKFVGINRTYEEFYRALVDATCNVKEVTFPAISTYMEEHGTPFTSGKRIGVSQKVRAAFEKIESNVRFITFLKEIAKYKNYDFSGDVKMTVTAQEEETEEDTEGEEFKILTEDWVKRIQSSMNMDFSIKVGVVLERILSPKDRKFFDDNHDKFVQMVVRTADSFNSGENLLDALNKNANELFGGVSHMAKAYLYQSIKEYCGFDSISEGKIGPFFEDIIKLM